MLVQHCNKNYYSIVEIHMELVPWIQLNTHVTLVTMYIIVRYIIVCEGEVRSHLRMQLIACIMVSEI